MKRQHTTATTLRNQWAAIPGVAFPTEATTAPRTPRTSPRRATSNPNHRPRLYRQHPDLYTSHGTRRLHPIGTPADPQWVDVPTALALTGLSRSGLCHYARRHSLPSCRYADPQQPRITRVYYLKSALLAIRPPRSK